MKVKPGQSQLLVYAVSQLVGILVLLGTVPATNADQITSLIADAIAGLFMVITTAYTLYQFWDSHRKEAEREHELDKLKLVVEENK